MAEYLQKEFKSILIIRKFIDSWFWDKYGINPYNGCQIGCVYCDSRSEKYHLPIDFENKILIKKNVKQMLNKRLTNARVLLPDVVGMAGSTDPYQPAEKKFKNTHQCLEILLKHKYPVHICTKSNLVLKDLELLDQIGETSWCTVSVTITTTDNQKANFLEKHAPSPEKRFEIIKFLKSKSKHIQAGVLYMPIIPFLCDSESDLENMVRKSKESGADYIVFSSGVTMRDLQAKWYLKHLKENFPELISKYENLFQFEYDSDSYEGSYGPPKAYSLKINKKIFEYCEKYSLPFRIRRFIPDDYRKMNYIIAEKLLNQSYEDQAMGRAWSNNFWAGQNIQILRESIVDIAGRNELKKIRNVNPQIERFIIQEIKNYH